MPTATTYLDFHVSNFGPLTTTYAAPQSCSTGTSFIGAVLAKSPDVQWASACEASAYNHGDCLPAGSAIDAHFSSALQSDGSPNIVIYHSPGLACPAGWATAGSVAKASDGSLVSPSGVLSHTPVSSALSEVTALNAFEVLENVLDPGETAAVCCPSQWTVNQGGGCYSVLPASAYRPTVGCLLELPPSDYVVTTTTFTLAGHAVSGPLMLITGTAPLTADSTTFSTNAATSYLGASILPMVTLVYKAGDGTAGSSAATSSNPSNSLNRGGSDALILWPIVWVAISMVIGAGIVLS